MPRHGGLDVTDRSQMPSKKEPGAMPQQAPNFAGGANPFATATGAAVQGGGLTANGAGPLSQRVAQANQAVQEMSQGQSASRGAGENQRTPVTSLKPDISKFGFAQNIQQNTQGTGQNGADKNNPGVEF